jgi:hypothetical protein
MPKWKKMGLIVSPAHTKYSTSHCQHPTPVKIFENIYRVFYGSRNSENLTQVFSFDFDIDNLKVLDIESLPLLTLGELGGFDQHGIYPSSVVENQDGNFFLYTIGFTQGKQPLYHTGIGLSTMNNECRNLNKFSIAPILSVSEYDPCNITGPYVIKENEIYRMWYVSCFKWTINEGYYQSHYHIKYAESVDGINWKRDGLVSIDHVHPGETNIARPWILKEDGIYKAWFSYCCGKQGYRIGYAESADGGYKFERMDHLAGIHPSDEPWENEAVAYPAVIVHKGKKYMFYNGNKFGKDGVALAIEE